MQILLKYSLLVGFFLVLKIIELRLGVEFKTNTIFSGVVLFYNAFFFFKEY